jgi:hypothetical protein
VVALSKVNSTAESVPHSPFSPPSPTADEEDEDEEDEDGMRGSRAHAQHRVGCGALAGPPDRRLARDDGTRWRWTGVGRVGCFYGTGRLVGVSLWRRLRVSLLLFLSG